MIRYLNNLNFLICDYIFIKCILIKLKQIWWFEVKLAFSKTAIDYIYERNEIFSDSDPNKFVVVMFFHSGGSWTIDICGNILELVEKHKILNEEENFIKWTDLKGGINKIEVYIEKDILPELINQKFILVDAAIGKLENGEKFGMLFIKKDDSVYHSMIY